MPGWLIAVLIIIGISAFVVIVGFGFVGGRSGGGSGTVKVQPHNERPER